MSKNNRRARAARSNGARVNTHLRATSAPDPAGTSAQATSAPAGTDATEHDGARFIAIERTGPLDHEPECPFAVVEAETGQVPENWFGQSQQGYHRDRQGADAEAQHLNELAARFQPADVNPAAAVPQLRPAAAPQTAEPSSAADAAAARDGDTAVIDLSAAIDTQGANGTAGLALVPVRPIRPMLGERATAWERYLLNPDADAAQAGSAIAGEPELAGTAAPRGAMAALFPVGIEAALEADRRGSHAVDDTLTQLFPLAEQDGARGVLSATPMPAPPVVNPAQAGRLPRITDGRPRSAAAPAGSLPTSTARLYDADAETVRRQIGDEVERQGVRRIAAVSHALDGDGATAAAAQLLIEPERPMAPNVVIKALMDTALDVRPSLQTLAPEQIEAGQLVLCSDGSWRTTAGGSLQGESAVLLMPDGTEHVFTGVVQLWVREPQPAAGPVRPPCPNGCTATADRLHRCPCPFSCGCAPHPDGPARRASARQGRRSEHSMAGA